jgi:hypothetical protein
LPFDTETLPGSVFTLFIEPHDGLNQQFDHFVVSSEVPLNSSSNLRVQLPGTPVGTMADEAEFVAEGDALTGGVVGESVGVGTWVGVLEFVGVGEFDGVGELECHADGEALTCEAVGVGRCCP